MEDRCQDRTRPSVNPGNPDRVDDTEFDFCPHFTKPFPDCFCRQFDSLNIPKIVAYCNGVYSLCPVFRRALARPAPPEDTST